MPYKRNLKVSIFMIAYNHSNYIERAIEGILMQKTNFPFKLFIGEDCSTDETRNICLRYKAKHPEKIELILNDKNIGMMANARNVYKACFAYGSYTAMCEGDDCWTDNLKLQKQVDFLEKNVDFAICYHRMKEICEEGIESISTKLIQKEVTTFEDLAITGNYIYTASCVFRNIVPDLPEWFYSMPVGDFALHLFNSQFGKIKFLNENMGVYRAHSGGVWSGKTEDEKNKTLICLWKLCRKRFYPRGYREFSQYLTNVNTSLCFNYFEDNEFKKFRKHYFECVKLVGFLGYKNFLALTLRYFLSYLPQLAFWYKKLKN